MVLISLQSHKLIIMLLKKVESFTVQTFQPEIQKKTKLYNMVIIRVDNNLVKIH